MPVSSRLHSQFDACGDHHHVKLTTADINRLFSAADALLGAVQTPAGTDAIVEITFDDRTGIAMVNGTRFTSEEMVEAMGFLVRAGYLEPA